MRRVKYIGASDEQVRWGGNDDPRECLKDGETYEVKEEIVYSWHTKLVLEEYPDKRFNSVSFEEVRDDNEVPSGAWSRSDYVVEYGKLRAALEEVVGSSFYSQNTGYYHCKPSAILAAKKLIK